MKREWAHVAKELRRSIAASYPNIPIADLVRDPTLPDTYFEAGGADVPDIFRFNREDMRPALFDYQRDVVDQICNLRQRSALLALPTGAGKTRTAVAAILAGIAEDRVHNVVWLAPSVELVEQAFNTFRDVAQSQGNLRSMVLTREPLLHHKNPLVLLTTPQTIYARRADWRYNISWDLVVFDEAHQLGAPTFVAAIESLGVEDNDLMADNNRPTLLGLSATPGRVDPAETEDLVSLFHGVLIKSDLLGADPVKTLQQQGVLANLHFKQFTQSRIELTDEARRLVIAASACNELVERGRRPLVFASSVPAAIVLDDLLSLKEIRSAVLHSETPPNHRRSVLSDFAIGRIDVVLNQRLLSTGYDCPAVTDVLILGRVSSPILFEQMVGRAARGPKTGGSTHAYVWDFDDHLSLHGRPRSYYRYRDFDWS